MKRVKHLSTALPRAQKEAELVKKKLCTIRKAIEDIENINEANRWMNYLGEDFNDVDEDTSSKFYNITYLISRLDGAMRIVDTAFSEEERR